MSVSVDGLDDLIEEVQELDRDTVKGASEAIEATAIELRGDIVKRYQRGPASGRTYEKYKPRRTHTASAPGEAPMSDLGDAAKNTLYRVTDKLTAEVYNPLQYPVWLEFGTRLIKPRPAWVPAIEAKRGKFRKRLEAVIEKATP